MLQQSSNSAASSAGDAGSMPDAHVVAQEMLSRYALPGATTPAAELIHQHSLQVAADLARWASRLQAAPAGSIVEPAVDDAAARVWEAMQEAGYLFSGGPLSGAHPDDQQHARRIALAAIAHQSAPAAGDPRLREAALRNALEHIAGSCDGRAAEVARVALAGAPAPASEETITVQQAWEWAGGNPEIRATREELEDALRDLDAICDEAAEVAIPADAGAVERGARAVAAVESWGGWDTNSPTPNGNTPDEQREWCRDVARAVLAAATSPASASARCTACGKPKHGDRPILMCACATLVMVPKGSAP